MYPRQARLSQIVRIQASETVGRACRECVPADILGIFRQVVIGDDYRKPTVQERHQMNNQVIDRAIFTEPLQFSEGIRYVLVNGKLVLNEGNHTGEPTGEILYGPGYRKL